MPYISQDLRDSLLPEITKLAQAIRDKNMHSGREGQMNYAISELINQVYNPLTMRYSDMNDVVGMLECCKREFQRCVVDNYEARKSAENGRVYPTEPTTVKNIAYRS